MRQPPDGILRAKPAPNGYPVLVTSSEQDALPALGEHRLARWLTILLFTGIAVICALPVLSRDPWMIFVQDDLLYYLKVAQNIAHGHGSTFNGIVPTNGYQPLWLLVLLCVSYVTESGRAVLAFLAVSNVVAACATFLLARSLLRSTGVRSLLAFALASFVTLYSLTLFFYGMEVTLTVPIVLGVLCLLRHTAWLSRSPLHTFALGLLLSTMVLSRIDTLILGGLILAGILVTPSLRGLLRPALVLGTGLGLLPILFYFLLNHRFFHTWLPISGMAKELKANHIPSIEPWRVFFHPLAGGFALILVAALLLLHTVRERLSPMERILYPAVIVFPFIYYFILCCVSDWTLWGWYMYPIRTALCVSLVIFCLWPTSTRLLQQPIVTAILVLLVFVSLGVMRWRRQQTDIYAASVEIQNFAATHPGTYAMGDRAGRVAALIPDPVLQTEGLMMDRDFLQLVAARTPLRDVLARYHAQYYIGTAYEPYSGCFEAAEPAKAGPTSAKMRAEFCEKPLATFNHDGVTTLIYDLPTPAGR